MQKRKPRHKRGKKRAFFQRRTSPGKPKLHRRMGTGGAVLPATIPLLRAVASALARFTKRKE